MEASANYERAEYPNRVLESSFSCTISHDKLHYNHDSITPIKLHYILTQFLTAFFGQLVCNTSVVRQTHTALLPKL